MSESIDRAFSPARLGKLELKSRIIKAATYEGKTPVFSGLAKFVMKKACGRIEPTRRPKSTTAAA